VVNQTAVHYLLHALQVFCIEALWNFNFDLEVVRPSRRFGLIRAASHSATFLKIVAL